MPVAQFVRTIAVSRDVPTCWSILTDVERIAGWVSIVGPVEEREHLKAYTTVLEDRMGPFRLRAALDIEVTDVVEQRSLSLRAQGEDRQVASRIAVDATLRLDGDGDGDGEGDGHGTSVTVDGLVRGHGAHRHPRGLDDPQQGPELLDEFFAAAERELA